MPRSKVKNMLKANSFFCALTVCLIIRVVGAASSPKIIKRLGSSWPKNFCQDCSKGQDDLRKGDWLIKLAG